MKKLLLFCAFFLAVQNYAFSQISLLKNASRGFSIGVTYNNWVQMPDSVTGTSITNLGFDYNMRLLTMYNERKTRGITLGLGISTQDFHTNIFPWRFDSTGAVNEFSVRGKNDYRKNKLSLAYIDVPLEFVFSTKKEDMETAKWNKGFKFALGFRGGFCIDAKQKIKTDDGTKIKVKSFENVNRLRFGPTMRVGAGAFTLYTFYNLASTFTSASIDDFNAYSVGLYFTL